METQAQTLTRPRLDEATERKIQKLRELFADALQLGKAALENALQALAPGGAKRLRIGKAVASFLGKIS